MLQGSSISLIPLVMHVTHQHQLDRVCTTWVRQQYLRCIVIDSEQEVLVDRSLEALIKVALDLWGLCSSAHLCTWVEISAFRSVEAASMLHMAKIARRRWEKS